MLRHWPCFACRRPERFAVRPLNPRSFVPIDLSS
jgi:hypothetical protein